MFRIEELLHKGCFDRTARPILPTACLRERFGDEESQQMGKRDLLLD